MNEQVAYAVIDAELGRLQELSYSDLSALIGKVETKERVGGDGKTYQLEIQDFWDSKKGADVRLIVAADNGGWRAFKPLTGNFILRPDGSLRDISPTLLEILKVDEPKQMTGGDLRVPITAPIAR